MSFDLQLSDFRDRANEVLHGGDYDDLSVVEQASVNKRIFDAEREFWLEPPGDPTYIWSCLREEGSLVLWASVALSEEASGTVAAGTTTTFIATSSVFTEEMVGMSILVTGGSTYTITAYTSGTTVTVNSTAVADIGLPFVVAVTVTAVGTAVTASSASFHETMVGKSIVITGVGTFTITAYTSTTVVTVSSSATCTRKTFSIAANGVYRMPSRFLSPRVPMLVCGDTSMIADIDLMDAEIVRKELSRNGTNTGSPCSASIKWGSFDGTAAHTQDIMLNIIPYQDFTVYLPHSAQAIRMTDAAPYPRGGDEMAETLMSWVLAKCEQHVNDGRSGPVTEDARKKIAAAMQSDRTRHSNFIAGMMRSGTGYGRQRYPVRRTNVVLT